MSHLKIVSDRQYQEVASRIETLKDAEPGTPRAVLLKFLVDSIVHHERGKKETAYSGSLSQ